MIEKLVLGTIGENCYLVIRDGQAICIDPGSQGMRIIRLLRYLNVDLKTILLTHGHFDHIGAVDKLVNQFQCDVYATKDTIDVVHDPDISLTSYYDDYVIESPIKEMPDTLSILSLTIQCIHTPGHCKGCCMYYIPEENALFTGDTLFNGSIGRYDFPTSSIEETKASIKIIKSLDFDADIYPGHGEASTLSYEKKHNPYLR